jgi:hypothetical protein
MKGRKTGKRKNHFFFDLPQTRSFAQCTESMEGWISTGAVVGMVRSAACGATSGVFLAGAKREAITEVEVEHWGHHWHAQYSEGRPRPTASNKERPFIYTMRHPYCTIQ